MENFDHFLKKELNKPQRKAVTKKDGAMIVVAGAGSGKTRVITSRMANLILNEQVEPSSILALTFTNKAAGEMKDRLIHFLSSDFARHHSKLPFVGTFHSYCLLLLKTNPTLLPFPNFSIIDEDDQKSIVKKIIKKNNLEKQFSAREVCYQISKVKNQIDRNKESIYRNPIFKEIFLAYESEKAAAHCFDFDDLLLVVLKIFQTNKDFKEKFQAKIRHVLVDEYQDTNGVQHELLKEIGLDKNKKFALDSICAVGDEDQSIYSWRGAIATNMLSFKSDFSPVEIIKIEQNYRSVQPILKAANHVIEHNSQRYPKKLWSEKKGRDRILSVTCKSGYHEADTVAAYLQSLPKKKKLRNVAILYRTHFQSRSLEESLIRNSIPYVIIGGIRFYERKEIKDMLAYLKLTVNPFDRTSLFRIINCPSRGLGAKFEELLYTEWNNNTLFDFKQILLSLVEKQEGKSPKVTGVKAKAVKNFISVFDDLATDGSPSIMLSKILERTEYLSYLRKAYDKQDSETKIENIQELSRSIENFSSLESFLHDVALLQEKLENSSDQEDHVQMMTLHAAKGLEFDTVIMPGLEEGMLPSMKSLAADEALEEERRLFYVGMTRAKERLLLLRTLCRNSYGQILDQVVSRFLAEIPTKLVRGLDLTAVHPAKTKTLFSQWLGSKLEQTITTFKPPKQLRNKKQKAKTAKKKTSPNFLAAKQERKTTGPWKRNQVIQHKKFGMGVVKKIERISEDSYHLTIFFKIGTKKISSKFVKKV